MLRISLVERIECNGVAPLRPRYHTLELIL